MTSSWPASLAFYIAALRVLCFGVWESLHQVPCTVYTYTNTWFSFQTRRATSDAEIWEHIRLLTTATIHYDSTTKFNLPSSLQSTQTPVEPYGFGEMYQPHTFTVWHSTTQVNHVYVYSFWKSPVFILYFWFYISKDKISSVFYIGHEKW